jgi:hypothetical protein
MTRMGPHFLKLSVPADGKFGEVTRTEGIIRLLALLLPGTECDAIAGRIQYHSAPLKKQYLNSAALVSEFQEPNVPRIKYSQGTYVPI